MNTLSYTRTHAPRPDMHMYACLQVVFVAHSRDVHGAASSTSSSSEALMPAWPERFAMQVNVCGAIYSCLKFRFLFLFLLVVLLRGGFW